MKDSELPEDAFYLENRYGRIYPKSEGYYGFEVGYQPAYHYWQDAKYTIDIFKEGKFVTSITCKHGEF